MSTVPAVKGLGTGNLIVGSGTSQAYRTPSRYKCIVANNVQLVSGGEDFAQGSPATPSLRMDAAGKFRFRWVLSAGNHTLSVNVLQAFNQSPRPSVVVKANPAIGLSSDTEVTAASGTGWVTVSVPITASALGAVFVELKANLEDVFHGFAPCYWDHLADATDVLSEFVVWLDGAPVIPETPTDGTDGGGGTTTTFMAQKLQLIVKPVAPTPVDVKNPQDMGRAVDELRKFSREAERAFREIEKAFNTATSSSS